ncbi:MAG TPA: insulinase family protein, partial [bacterium]|nr:insulinase family protein [bacterium]
KDVLDNGLTFMIRENSRPENRAELRLVVKAGSVDEDDDQRGLAHFVEHMLFNGTESWAGNEIIDYLETIGADFGADLNAYTSFDETVYLLEVPTDHEGVLHDGLKILGEFAWKATLTDEEIEKERGVVLDEWRRGLGAGQRIRDQQFPVLLKGSRYADRLPIGLPEIIRNAPPDAIRRYYRDWYRPERMAVLAVGDFDPGNVEAWIREVFGAIPSTEELRESVEWEVPAQADTLFALADDPELRGSSVGISVKREPREDEATYGAYRQDLVERLTLRMFNARLGEIVRSDDAPFLGAGLGTSRLGETVEIAELSATVRSGEEARGLEAVITEARRAELHGFAETELERARRSALSGIESAYAEREKTPSGAYVSEFTRHFLDGEPVPGIAAEVAIWREVLPGITVEECERAFREMRAGDGVVVEASRPTSEGLSGRDELMAAVRAAAAAAPEAWEDVDPGQELLAERLPPGQVTDRVEHEELGVTELRLSNGATVFVKPTDFQDDAITFTAQALGGTSVVSDEDLLSADAAGRIVAEAGYGGYSSTELRKILAGKVVSATPFFNDRYHGVTGGSNVADLSTLLDAIVMVMTRPNDDPAAFRRILDRMTAVLENRSADPSARYFDRLVEINTVDAPRLRPLTLDRLDEIRPEKALEFYRACFANAADFAFFFAGNVDVEALIPQLERTVGSLPSQGRPGTGWVERSVPFPDEPVRETVRAGREPKGRTTFTLRSYDGSDPREWHRIRTAVSILERRLRETLREDLGATYGVGAGYSFDLVGPNRGLVRIAFGSDPGRSEELFEKTRELLEQLRRDGPTEAEIAREREIQINDMETALETNGFWTANLASQWMRERPLEEIRHRIDRVRELDREGIHRVLQEHLGGERWTVVFWKPEEVAP